VHDIVVKHATKALMVNRLPHDFQRTVAGDLLHNDVATVTVQKLLGHAHVPQELFYDRRGQRAKKKAVGILHVPYQ